MRPWKSYQATGRNWRRILPVFPSLLAGTLQGKPFRRGLRDKTLAKKRTLCMFTSLNPKGLTLDRGMATSGVSVVSETWFSLELEFTDNR